MRRSSSSGSKPLGRSHGIRACVPDGACGAVQREVLLRSIVLERASGELWRQCMRNMLSEIRSRNDLLIYEYDSNPHIWKSSSVLSEVILAFANGFTRERLMFIHYYHYSLNDSPPGGRAHRSAKPLRLCFGKCWSALRTHCISDRIVKQTSVRIS